MKVPFFNYPHLFESEKEGLIDVIKDVGGRGAFIMQKDMEIFEKELTEYTGAKYAVGVANATDGMQMALMAGGIGDGDEVIISSHTMVATASAVHFSGATPVPVEAGPDHMMDPASIEKAITSKTKVILPTQLNGRTCNMDAISKIADKNGLQIFEDAAQALGSKYKGKCAGTFGRGACISFYPAKVLGCLGDAGAVLTNDEKVYYNLIRLRDHGRGADGEITMWGFNSRLDNLQAAILSYNFKKYPQIVERRREIAGMYQEQLGSLKELVLPPAPLDNSDHFDVYQNYEIETPRRDELQAYLAERGIGTLVQWGGTAIHQFKSLGFQQHLPQTDRLFERMLMIPMNMSLTNEQVITVCDTIKSFYRDK